jgi:membrane fusion protein, heavy metal efflux system
MRNIFISFFLIGMLFSCKSNQEKSVVVGSDAIVNTEVDLSEQAIENAGITVGLAQMGRVQEKLKVNGMVDVPPESLVSVSFPLGGYLKHTQMLPGRPVRKGEVIGIMEDQSYVQLQQDYLQSVAKINLLKMDYQRQMELREDDATSKKAFEMARTELEMQQILVKSLSEKLLIIGVSPQTLTVDKISRTVPLRSPISGFVKSVFVNVGKYVNPSDVMFEIVDPDHIHGSLMVFEKDFAKVKKGLHVQVYSQERPEKAYHAEVILVSRDVDNDRGITVHCHFLGEHSGLIPGMYISAEIDTDSQMLPLVPESAVVRFEGKHYVFIENAPGKYTMREVTTGQYADGKIALTANYIDWTQQRLVLTGAYALLGKLKNVEDE